MRSLARMPVYIENSEKGVLVDFTKALAKEFEKQIYYGAIVMVQELKSI